MERDNRSLALGLLALTVGVMAAFAIGSKKRKKKRGPPPVILLVSGGTLKRSGRTRKPVLEPVKHLDEITTSGVELSMFNGSQAELAITAMGNSKINVITTNLGDSVAYEVLDVQSGIVYYTKPDTSSPKSGLAKGRRFIVRSRGFAVGAPATAFWVEACTGSAIIGVTSGYVEVVAINDFDHCVVVRQGEQLRVVEGMPVDTNDPGRLMPPGQC